MDIDNLAQAIFGRPRAETQEVSTNSTTRTYTGVATSDSVDGTVMIDLGGDVTLPDDLYDEDGNVVAEYASEGIEVPTGPSVQEGDEVTVTLVGGGALKTPMVTSVSGEGDRQNAAIALAKTVADAAQAVSDAVNQHFFADTNGIHVTEVTQEEWGESPTGANVLINSIGQLFRDGLNNLLTLTTENGARALTIWDGLGNAASNVRAVIGETIQLGKSDGPHVTIDSGSMGFWASAAQLAMRFTGQKVDYPSGNSTYFAQIEDGVTRENEVYNDNGYISLYTLEAPTYEGSDEKVVVESMATMHAYTRGEEGTAEISVFMHQDPDANTASRGAIIASDTLTCEGTTNVGDPYGSVDGLTIGNPTRVTSSKSCTALTNDTTGPYVSLSAGKWLVMGNWNFLNSSSNAKRLVVGLYRNATGQAYTYRVHTTASSSSSHRLEVVDTIVLTSDETITLYGASDPASTSAGTQWISAIRLA